MSRAACKVIINMLLIEGLRLLRDARAIVRLAPADRSGDPPVLCLDASSLERHASDPERLVDKLLSAGQVTLNDE